jgi:pyrroloquinoline-quinone synthase
MNAAGREAFLERLTGEGRRRYHDKHPFHVAMHEGTLRPEQLRHWVRNRFYYQSRIPVKDALILAKSEDASFRRRWIRRIHEQDGSGEGEGGLEAWLRLGEAVGLEREELVAHRGVARGVRFACDAYVELVARASLLEAVASSLTEAFAPDLMTARMRAWELHYPWVDPSGLAYFRMRVSAAKRDADDAIGFVLEHATTVERQDACVAALVKKTDILWHLLDCVESTCGEE